MKELKAGKDAFVALAQPRPSGEKTPIVINAIIDDHEEIVGQRDELAWALPRSDPE